MASDGDYVLVIGESKPIWCPHCMERCGLETPMYWVSLISVNSLNPTRACPQCKRRNLPMDDGRG